GRSAAVLLGAWSLGVAVTCAGFLIAALGASDLTHYVFDARWQQPTGYANTAAALPAMAFWPALMLSARRRTARPLQVLFVVTAVFLLDFALLGALLGLAAARGGSLPHYVSHQWRVFKARPVNTGERASYTRLGTLTSDKRYDYWRVALDAFGDHPLAGVGAGNFERVYTLRRDYPKHSRSAHDIWMRSLSETGVVGTALLAGTVLAALAGLLSLRRRLDDERRLLVAACVAVGAYFVGHGSFDWLELVPAVAVPGVALPFLALTLSGAPPPPAIRRRGLLSGAAVAVSLAALV